MAQGCATIYTKRGCGPEIIEHGKDGLLVDPDRPSEIADAIVTVLEDDSLAKRLGSHGCEKVRQRFAPEVIIPQNEAFYEACVSRFRRSDGI